MTDILQQLPDFKAGDTFSLAGTCALPDGTWSATCTIRTRYTAEKIGELSVDLGTPVDGLTPLVLAAPPEDTINWQPTACILDVRYLDNTGVVAHSTTIGIRIISPVTEAAP